MSDTATEQLALDLPTPEAGPRTYWRRGPKGWHPVTVTIRYGSARGLPAGPVLPEVRTGARPPRNVLAVAEDGTAAVVPVRTLRRHNPHDAQSRRANGAQTASGGPSGHRDAPAPHRTSHGRTATPAPVHVADRPDTPKGHR